MSGAVGYVDAPAFAAKKKKDGEEEDEDEDLVANYAEHKGLLARAARGAARRAAFKEALTQPCFRRVCLLPLAESDEGFAPGDAVRFADDFVARTGMGSVVGRVGRVLQAAWTQGAQIVQVAWSGGGTAAVLASNLARA
jgi:hypothetical protein